MRSNKPCAKNTSLKGGIGPQLTPTEREIFYMLAELFMTPAQIAQRRGTTIRAVQLVRDRLIKKGYLRLYPSKSFIGMPDGEAAKACAHSAQKIRLHALKVRVQILRGSLEYERARAYGNRVLLWSHTVLLNSYSLQLFLKEDFIADTAAESTAKAMDYLTRMLTRL